MTEILTESIQDYLKEIYELTVSGSPASTTELAARLGVAPASVTGMVQRLANATPPLLVYRKHQGVTLTPQGERAALEVIRHHRLLETYLVQALGYSWDEVHEEASRLEHVISEDFEARIARALGNPARDPHGDPIPSPDLTMPIENTRPLSSLRPPERGTITRVNDENPDFLRHLTSIGLVPGAEVSAQAYSEFDGNLTLRVGDRTLVVGSAITDRVFITSN
ncbi:MAG: metal-dependent transcriptional regulator [Bacteroidota bacterium]